VLQTLPPPLMPPFLLLLLLMLLMLLPLSRPVVPMHTYVRAHTTPHYPSAKLTSSVLWRRPSQQQTAATTAAARRRRANAHAQG
jgi:hypothetical protein